MEKLHLLLLSTQVRDFRHQLALKFPDDWSLARSESGWMNAEIFYEYFANYFLKWLKDQSDIKFPIVMFLDGHKSHLSYHLSKLCSQSQIILIALPPNTTHMMQVLDVAIFNPVKQGWSVSVHEWCMTKLLEEDVNHSQNSTLHLY